MPALHAILALAHPGGPRRLSRPEPGDGLALRRRLGLARAAAAGGDVALGPIALGHALAIGLAAVVVGALGFVIPQRLLLALGGVVLIGFAAYKVATRFRHPRWVGMRVGPRELVLWSFLMASAHGAGLMLVPVLVGLRGEGVSSALAHADHARAPRARPIRRQRRPAASAGRGRPALGGDARRRGGGRRGRLPEARRGDIAPRLGQPRSHLGRRAGDHRWDGPGAGPLARPGWLIGFLGSSDRHPSLTT